MSESNSIFETMISMEQKKEINEALRRICKHELFARSSTYSRLLTYLVEKAIIGEDLKEYTIGADLFGENYSNDKNDGTVRSKMYKLRKKLSKYYESEGSMESLRLHIEKGQYNLSFEDANTKSSDYGGLTIQLSRKSIIILGLLFFLVVSGFLIIKFQSHYTSKLWKPFLEKRAKNIVVVSDHYVVSERLSDNEFHAVLFNDINNSSSLYEYRQAHPNRELQPTDYTLMSKMSPYGIKAISKWLYNGEKDYEIMLESKLNSEDVSHNNLIFIGQFKSMNLSSSLFLKDSKVFTTYLDGFKYTNKGVEKIYNTKHKPNGKKEYAIVSYTSHSEGNKSFYFVSNNDIGVLATLKRFTNKTWLKEFEHQLPNKTHAFNALFEVSGLQRTDVSCELVELELLK